MLVYLGGPIDLAGNKDYRADLTKALHREGINAFDPKDAFKMVKLNDPVDARRLVEINRQAMLNCTVPVFVMDANVLSVGTSIEIYMAHEANKRSLVIWLSDSDKPIPAYISALVRESDIICSSSLDSDTINQVVNKLKSMKKLETPMKLKNNTNHNINDISAPIKK